MCYGAGLKTHGPPEQASKATEDEKARGYTHTLSSATSSQQQTNDDGGSHGNGFMILPATGALTGVISPREAQHGISVTTLYCVNAQFYFLEYVCVWHGTGLSS